MSNRLDKPLVSMLIPSHNHASFVRECIESVIRQDYENIELLIIDDGSTDCSVQLINDLLPICIERFVRFEFRARENRGLAATANEALQWAKGTYFAAIASDDRLLKCKTARLVDVLEHEQNNIAGVFSGCLLIDDSGLNVGNELGTDMNYSFNDIIMHRHSIHAATQLLRKDALLEVGGYAEDIYIEDWFMWLKLTQVGYVLKSIPDTLVEYRIHSSNGSNNLLRMYESKMMVLSHYREHRLYKKAVANIYIWTAINFADSSKRDALAYLLQSLKTDVMSVFRPFFYRAVLRIAGSK
jgi:alpha-1,3-rhamnosyltransferase